MNKKINISPQDEEINNMIAEISMRIFLRATPYASGDRTDLEIEMTPDFFYNHLYWHSQEAEDYLNNIKDRINRDSCKNIILYGYQGCGKTTFVHYLLQRLDSRSILINFDAYVDKGNEIKHELVSHLYRVIMHDMTGRDGRNGMYKVNGKICATSKKFCEVFNSPENRRIISENYDSWNHYVWFIDKLNFTMLLYSSTAELVGLSQEEFDSKKITYPETDLKVHIANLDINQLMVVIVLWDIAYSLAFQNTKKCCIVFENLDTIYNASELPDFTKQILYFRNNIDSIIADLQYEGTALSKTLGRYILIFVMRETTKCEFVDHFVGKVEMYIPPKSMSFLYEMRDIVRHRNKYLHQLKDYLKEQSKDTSKLERLEEELNIVENLLADSYIADKMFGLFNRNFRVCTAILSEITFTSPSTFNDAIHVRNMSQTENWDMYASRCILFRQIFNKFSAEKYFDIIKNSEYHVAINHKNYSVNLCRYILLYLNNAQGITKSEEEKENVMVSLFNLYSALLNICDDKKLIINSLWNMYELRKKQFWGHLITFDGILTLNKNALEEQLEWVISNEKDKTYGNVRITTAGFAYLDLLLPHFEYFAARRFKSGAKSLFSFNLEELLNISPDKSTCSLEYNLLEVQKEVDECYYRLSQFYKKILNKKELYALNNFLNSGFAWQKVNQYSKSIVKMFHGERIVHSHIGYLDALRFYCFKLVDNMAKKECFDMNLDILGLIQNVMNIRGSRSYIPTISKLYNNGAERFLICPETIFDNITKLKMQKVKVKKNEVFSLNYVPLNELITFLKVSINYIIVNAIERYIKMFRMNHPNDYTVASTENIYLISCYLACIIENIKKVRYTDFETSICRKTGAKIIKDKLKEKKISHRSQYGKQLLEKETIKNAKDNN